jgi:hypothetical protein
VNHWTATALAADSRPGDLERLLGTLIASESALLRVREERKLRLDRRQPVLKIAAES